MHKLSSKNYLITKNYLLSLFVKKTSSCQFQKNGFAFPTKSLWASSVSLINPHFCGDFWLTQDRSPHLYLLILWVTPTFHILHMCYSYSVCKNSIKTCACYNKVNYDFFLGNCKRAKWLVGYTISCLIWGEIQEKNDRCRYPRSKIKTWHS